MNRALWLGRYLRAEAAALTAGAAAMAARALVLLALPWPLKIIIDNVIFRRPLAPAVAAWMPDPMTHRMALLDWLGLAMLGLGALDAALVYAGNRLFLNAAQRVMFAIRFDLFAHLQRLSLAFHQNRRGGEVMARLGGDVRQLQDFSAALGIDLLPHALTILGMAAVMLVMDWRYATLALALVPVLVLIARHYATRLRRALRLLRTQESALQAQAQEVLAGVQLVQAFGREAHETHRFGAQARETLAAGTEANAVQAEFGPAMNFTIALATGAIAWYGAARVIDGALSPGQLLIFLAYLRGIATPARQLAKTGRIFGRGAVALERVGDYLREAPGIADPPDAAAPDHCAGVVTFQAVRFGYRPDRPVLHGIDLTLSPGRTVALVGATGSGKSTIAALIPRFFDPQGGRILLDGRDLASLPLGWLRRQIALVTQEPLLFQATVWENIAYGREGAGRAEAMRAAEAIGIGPIIAGLPDGFDTRLRERGLGLSGGQRQCIALARAMLRDAPVVILDEPTASLDPETEARLTDALHRLTTRRAALVIAHRLGTVTRADTILVLDQGRVVQQGTHAGLLAEGGVYSTLWRALRREERRDTLRLVAP